MRVIADLCLVPMGVTASVSKYVKEVKLILESSGLVVEMHANGTNIEGDLSDITIAIEKCHNKLFEMGVPRVFCTLIFSSRIDRHQSMSDKMASVL